MCPFAHSPRLSVQVLKAYLEGQLFGFLGIPVQAESCDWFYPDPLHNCTLLCTGWPLSLHSGLGGLDVQESKSLAWVPLQAYECITARGGISVVATVVGLCEMWGWGFVKCGFQIQAPASDLCGRLD